SRTAGRRSSTRRSTPRTRRRKLHARPDGMVIGEVERINARGARLEIAQPDPVQVHSQIIERRRRGGERGVESLSRHEILDARGLRPESGSGQDMTDPAEVIRVEISADDTGATRRGAFANHRVELFEPLAGVETGIEVGVENPNGSRRRIGGRGKRHSRAAAEPQIVALQSARLYVSKRKAREN